MGLSVYFKNVLFAEKQDILLKIVRNNVMIFKQIKIIKILSLWLKRTRMVTISNNNRRSKGVI